MEDSVPTVASWMEGREWYDVATLIRENRIEEVFRNIRRAGNVQLCFLVDVTGSMQPYIDGVRKSIFDIVKKLTDDGPHVTFRNTKPEAQSMTLALVAYRDHCDAKQFEILEFTEDIDSFKAFCGRIAADGGEDDAEDVFGGLEKVLNLSWSHNCGTKVMFHICDAPCHGNEFHSGVGDDYPKGDPKGRTCKGLLSPLREKGIKYYFGKITPHTDIMIKKFSEAYGDAITEFDVKNVEAICESVITAVSQSISASGSSSIRSVGVVRRESVFTLDKKEPKWATTPQLRGTPLLGA